MLSLPGILSQIEEVFIVNYCPMNTSNMSYIFEGFTNISYCPQNINFPYNFVGFSNVNYCPSNVPS